MACSARNCGDATSGQKGRGRPAAPGWPLSFPIKSCGRRVLVHAREVQNREHCHTTREHPSHGARPPRATHPSSLTLPGWPRGSSCSASSGIPATASRRRWCGGPMARSSRCPGCCTSWRPGSTAPATRRRIAALVSDDLGRPLNADQVRYLITAKLLPLGIVATNGAPRTLPRANPLLALRARGTLLPERAANAVGTFFRPLFRWPVIVAVLVSVAAMDYWVFAVHGLTAGAQQVLRDPVGPARRTSPCPSSPACSTSAATRQAAVTAARGRAGSASGSTWSGRRSSPTSPTRTGSAAAAGCAPTSAACTST